MIKYGADLELKDNFGKIGFQYLNKEFKFKLKKILEKKLEFNYFMRHFISFPIPNENLIHVLDLLSDENHSNKSKEKKCCPCECTIL